MNETKTFTAKDSTWIDEAGVPIPANRVTPGEILRERNAASLLKKGNKLTKDLQAYKEYISAVCDKIYKHHLKEKDVKAANLTTKGNYTWYSFNRSVKVMMQIKERIAFDELTIQTAKEVLLAFIQDQLGGNDAKHFIIEVVQSAFQTSSGKLDTTKVMSLSKYKSKIDHPEYTKAMDLIDESIRRPDSKRYFQVWEKDSEGEYQLINLNFAAISITEKASK